MRTLLVVDAVLRSSWRCSSWPRRSCSRASRPARSAARRSTTWRPALVLLGARRRRSGSRRHGASRSPAGGPRPRSSRSCGSTSSTRGSAPPRGARRDADRRGGDGGRLGRRRARGDLRALPAAGRARRRRPGRGPGVVVSIDPLAAGVMLLTLPLVPVFMWLVGRYTERQARERWQALALLSNHFLDVVRGLPTLRAFNRGAAQAERIARSATSTARRRWGRCGSRSSRARCSSSRRRSGSRSSPSSSAFGSRKGTSASRRR